MSIPPRYIPLFFLRLGLSVGSQLLTGAAWRFEDTLNNSEDSSTLKTSFIERLNLTIRQSSSYLSRRTLSHARSTERLDEHLELLRCYYNFVRPHGALKFGREIRTPATEWPAMQAGLTARRLTLSLRRNSPTPIRIPRRVKT